MTSTPDTAAAAWRLLLVPAVLIAAAAPAARAEEPPSQTSAAPAVEKVAPELKPDPEVMKIVDALQPGHGANLPRFKTAGDLNAVAREHKLDRDGPGARDYCIKMAWMPDRKRAIYYGANHGAPHRLNDVWEHDLPSNTWVCLYGPDVSKRSYESHFADLDRQWLEKGIVRTQRGGPTLIPHSWWNMTWDPQLGAMVTPISWTVAKAQAELRKKMRHSPPLWAFYPQKGKWEPVMNSKGERPRYENARQMEYVPELGGTLWITSAGMYLYNSQANEWKLLGKRSKYGEHYPPRESVAAYLPDRKLIVVHSRAGKGKPSTGYPESKTYHYSVQKDEWKLAHHGKEKDNPPPGFDARTNFVYDRAAGVCLLWDPSRTGALWSYDPETAAWRKLETRGDPPPTEGRDAMLAYYDAARNVLVVNGQWVYRHKQAAEAEAPSQDDPPAGPTK